MADRIGQHLGNYRLTRLLGQGGFAEVYLGEHALLGTNIAIKVLHTQVVPEDMALITQSSRYQNTTDMVGTIAYMAPEQIAGHPRMASDQYALGIVVYEWLCGTRPFHGS